MLMYVKYGGGEKVLYMPKGHIHMRCAIDSSL